MSFSHLFLAEKLYLMLRAYLDVRSGKRFSQTPRSTVTDDDRYGGGDTRPFIGEDNDADNLGIIRSPFIITELAKYAATRSHLIGRQSIVFLLISLRLRMPTYFSSFAKALAAIDRRVNDLSTDIDLLTIRHIEQLNEWALKRKRYEAEELEENAPSQAHNIQLCINKFQKIRSQYYDKVIPSYRKITSLLSTKLQLIDTMDAKLTAIRERRYLRVRYYYQAAVGYSAMYSKQLPDLYLEDEDMEQLANIGTLEGLQAEREETEAALNDFKEQISKLSSGH